MMPARNVEVVIVCEDTQHESFVRRFLKKRGYANRKFRVHKNPSGRGSAEQWVRSEYVVALKTYRSRQVDHVVISSD